MDMTKTPNIAQDAASNPAIEGKYIVAIYGFTRNLQDIKGLIIPNDLKDIIALYYAKKVIVNIKYLEKLYKIPYCPVIGNWLSLVKKADETMLAHVDLLNSDHNDDIINALNWDTVYCKSKETQIFMFEKHWRELHDPTSNHNYYWNTKTNETSWKKPDGNSDALFNF